MKHTKLVLALAAMAFSENVNAQIWTPGTGSDISTTTTGNCYIQGGLLDMNTLVTGDLADRIITANTSSHGLQLASGGGGAYLQMYGSSAPGTAAGSIYNVTTGGLTGGVDFIYNGGTSGAVSNMSIQNNGTITTRGDNYIGGNIITTGGIVKSLGNLRMAGGGTGAYIDVYGSSAGDIRHVTTGTNLSGGIDFVYDNGSSPVSNMSIQNNGTVLMPGGLLNMARPGDPGPSTITANSTQNGLRLVSGGGGSYIDLYGSGVGGPGSSSNSSIYNVTRGTDQGATYFMYEHGGTATVNMTVRNDGTVIIGGVSTPPSGGYHYGLVVQHGILTEKLKVANSTDHANWSDFVFNKDYELMPLSEVESFVQKNKHLPEIPSAKEVAKDGIDVADMDAKFLQKIEELTLYVIQQQKQLDKQKKEIDMLKKSTN
ncbi:MAG: hypothetical protein JWQ38_3632 [Flavipsychrobacter sp.]|nr:hypothetical protein [Flavipsychrobacter sp.]